MDVEVETYKSYPQRWVMLTLFGLGVCLNNAIWVAYTPIVDQAAETYDVSTSRVNLFASCYLVTTVIFVPVGSWICDTIGVRWIIILAGICNIVGSWVKYGSGAVDDPHTKYWVALAGQLICSLGQPLYEPAPPKLAALWFTNKERSLATGIGTLAGVSGLAVGYGLSIGLVNRDDPEHALGILNLTMAILVTVPSILGIIFYREQPPTPASPSAESSRDSFTQSGEAANLDVFFFLDFGHFLVLLET